MSAILKDRAASPQVSLSHFGVYNFHIHLSISCGGGVPVLSAPSQCLPGANYPPFYGFSHEKMKIHSISILLRLA
jgi:hypothetical protein